MLSRDLQAALLMGWVLAACEADLPEGKYRCETDAQCRPRLPYCAKSADGVGVCSASRARDASMDAGSLDGRPLSTNQHMPDDAAQEAGSARAESAADAAQTAARDAGAKSSADAEAGGAAAAPETKLLEETSYIKADSVQAQRRFGTSLALHGDLLVVGAPYDDVAETAVRYPTQQPSTAGDERRDVGAAYVYRRVDGEWTFEACLAVPNEVEAHFARSVAIDEAGARIVVGVAHRGMLWERVYLYARDAQERWVARWEPGLRNPPNAAGFGAAVAIHGDVLAVGAPDAEVPAVYVYALTADSTITSQPVRLTAPNAEGGTVFGRALALSGDTLVVGAPNFKQELTAAGAAFLFRRDSSTRQWSTTAAMLLSPDPDGYDFMGSAVAVDERFVAVGAPGAQPWLNGTQNLDREDEGAVHLFEVETGMHVVTARPSGEDTSFGELGQSVALDGMLLLAGAPGYHERYTGAGKAYLFRHGSWSKPSAILSAQHGDARDAFGAAVGVSGELAAVGSSREDSGGDAADNSSEDNGAAYVYTLESAR